MTDEPDPPGWLRATIIAAYDELGRMIEESQGVAIWPMSVRAYRRGQKAWRRLPRCRRRYMRRMAL